MPEPLTLLLDTSATSREDPEPLRQLLGQAVEASRGPVRLLAFDAEVHHTQEVREAEEVPEAVLRSPRPRQADLARALEGLSTGAAGPLLILSEMHVRLPLEAPEVPVLWVNYGEYSPRAPWGDVLPLSVMRGVDLAQLLPTLRPASERGRDLLYPPPPSPFRGLPSEGSGRLPPLLLRAGRGELDEGTAAHIQREALRTLQDLVGRPLGFYSAMSDRTGSLAALDLLFLRGVRLQDEYVETLRRYAGEHAASDLLLLRLPGVSLEHTLLSRLLRSHPTHPGVLATVLAHPSASEALWREGARMLRQEAEVSPERRQQALRVLAQTERARHLPEVQAAIAAHGNASSLVPLARVASPEVFDESLRRLLAESPMNGELVLRLLERARLDQREGVRLSTLLPLFSHPDAHIRLRAITQWKNPLKEREHRLRAGR